MDPKIWYGVVRNIVEESRKEKSDPIETVMGVLSIDSYLQSNVFGNDAKGYQQWHAYASKQLGDELTVIDALSKTRRREAARLVATANELGDLVNKFAVQEERKPFHKRNGNGGRLPNYMTREKAFSKLGWEYNQAIAGKIFPNERVTGKRVKKLRGKVLYSQAVPRLARKTGLSKATLNSSGWRQETLDDEFLENIGGKKSPVHAYDRKDEAKIIKYLKSR